MAQRNDVALLIGYHAGPRPTSPPAAGAVDQPSRSAAAASLFNCRSSPAPACTRHRVGPGDCLQEELGFTRQRNAEQLEELTAASLFNCRSSPAPACTRHRVGLGDRLQEELGFTRQRNAEQLEELNVARKHLGRPGDRTRKLPFRRSRASHDSATQSSRRPSSSRESTSGDPAEAPPRRILASSEPELRRA